MKTLFLSKVVIFMIFLMAFACNVKKGNSTVQGNSLKDTLVFQGCQENIKMTVGSVVVLKLEAIQGTGYQWIVKDPSPLLKQLRAEELEYSVADNKEVMVGKAGFQVLRFTALEAGEGTLRLEYRRTFEAGAEKSCVIQFRIDK